MRPRRELAHVTQRVEHAQQRAHAGGVSGARMSGVFRLLLVLPEHRVLRALLPLAPEHRKDVATSALPELVGERGNRNDDALALTDADPAEARGLLRGTVDHVGHRPLLHGTPQLRL